MSHNEAPYLEFNSHPYVSDLHSIIFDRGAHRFKFAAFVHSVVGAAILDGGRVVEWWMPIAPRLLKYSDVLVKQ